MRLAKRECSSSDDQSIACVPIRGRTGRAYHRALYVETRLRPGIRFERGAPAYRHLPTSSDAIEGARLITENRFERPRNLRAPMRRWKAARDELAGRLGKRTVELAEARRDLRTVRAELRGHLGMEDSSGPAHRCDAFMRSWTG